MDKKKLTPLLERMKEDLRLRNYSKHSEELYIYHTRKFTEYFNHSPEELGLEEVRKYLLHLLEREVSQSHYKQAVAALRFLYKYTLGREWVKEKIAYPRRAFTVPVVLTQEEVACVLSKVRKYGTVSKQSHGRESVKFRDRGSNRINKLQSRNLTAH